MSIASLCNRFATTITQKTSTRLATGDYTYAYTTGARGADPTSIQSEFQTMTSEELAEYGITGERKTWAMYNASDPKLGTEDRVAWTDNSSIARTCDVIEPSFAMAGRARIWKTIVEEVEADS